MRVLFLFLVIVQCYSAQKNNVCNTIEDYYTMDTNPNCWYDYITDLSVPEIIIKSGRPFEEYSMATSDGFILNLFRIPNTQSPNKRRSPVFLQHGLISTCAHWVALGNDSLAFQLHDSGFDVWLGNARGSSYSSEHIEYSPDDEEYWEHVVDDLALKDLPTMLLKVEEVTGTKGDIIYVGHSLGGTMALMYSSELPLEAKQRIKLMILAAPAYKLTHMKSPVRYMAPFSDLIWDTVKRYHLLRVASDGEFFHSGIRFFCRTSPHAMATCMNLFGLFYGPKSSIKPSQFPNFLNQQFSPSSLKVLKHAVGFVDDTYSKYDYGINNTRIYGQETPPSYNVSNIGIPIIIVYAENDWLTPKLDELTLYNDLNKDYVHSMVEIRNNFNHVDFMFGSRAKEMFINEALKYIQKFDKL